MLWEAAPDELKPRRFIIKKDSKVGFYVYVYEGTDNKCTYDYLQDTYEHAIGFAERKFEVPKDSWKQMK